MTADKDWTLEQAHLAQEQHARDRGLHSIAQVGPDGPLYQWFALHELDRLRAEFDRGDSTALLAAIRKCANHDVVLPEWVSRAFISAYDRVLACEAKSWDDVFGRPYPSGANVSAMRKRRRLRYAVRNEIQRILDAELATAIDVGLFERVGERLALGKTATQELYYESVKLLGPVCRPRDRASPR